MKNYKGNMLLIELVIVILFFSLSQVVIVQVFAQAQRRTLENSRMNSALMRAQSMLEYMTGVQNPEKTLEGMGLKGENGVYTMEGDGYQLEASVRHLSQPAGELVTVDFTARQDDKEMFAIPSVQYFPREGQP